MRFLNTCAVFDFNLFTNCMYFILFYRLNFIVLQGELHHVRFDVVYLILAGTFLGRPVLCDPLPHAASYMSLLGDRTAPLTGREIENNPLSSLAVSPEASLPRAKLPTPAATAALKWSLFLHSTSPSAPRALAAALPQPFPIAAPRPPPFIPFFVVRSPWPRS